MGLSTLLFFFFLHCLFSPPPTPLFFFWANFLHVQCSFFFSFAFFCIFCFCFFFFCLDVIFFSWHDFYFLINLGDWFVLVLYPFFGFNWASFFKKGICVNLYKLTYSILPFPTLNQTKIRKIKIFSILSLFHPPIIFYLFTFSLLQPNEP